VLLINKKLMNGEMVKLQILDQLLLTLSNLALMLLQMFMLFISKQVQTL